MIKQNQRSLNFILILADVVIILISFLCAWFLRFKTTLFGPLGGSLGIEYYVIFFILVVLPTYLILYFPYGLVYPRCGSFFIANGQQSVCYGFGSR